MPLYINPFRVFQLSPESIPESSLLKRQLRRAKQNLELEDADFLEYNGQNLAIGDLEQLSESLKDEETCHFHLKIAQNEAVCDFLETGEGEYLTDVSDDFPQLLKNSAEWEKWLSAAMQEALSYGLRRMEPESVEAIIAKKSWLSPPVFDEICQKVLPVLEENITWMLKVKEEGEYPKDVAIIAMANPCWKYFLRALPESQQNFRNEYALHMYYFGKYILNSSPAKGKFVLEIWESASQIATHPEAGEIISQHWMQLWSEINQSDAARATTQKLATYQPFRLSIQSKIILISVGAITVISLILKWVYDYFGPQ